MHINLIMYVFILPTVEGYFRYKDFSTTLSLNMQNAVRDGDQALLCGVEQKKTGSMWFSTQLNVAQGFDTSFRFKMKKGSGESAGSDGLAFVVQGKSMYV